MNEFGYTPSTGLKDETFIPKNRTTELRTPIQTLLDQSRDYINKMHKVIDVTMPPYNAVGNGTTDDTSAIQSAYDDIGSDGGTIYFPDGKTYLVDSQYETACFRIYKSNVSIIFGHNAKIAVKSTTKNVAVFEIGNDASGTFTKVDNIKITNLTATGNGDNTSLSSVGISVVRPDSTGYVKGDGCSNIEIDHCKFLGGFAFSVAATGVKGIKIHDCYITGNYYIPGSSVGGYGIITQTCFDVDIYNNEIISTSHDRHAIYISNDNNNAADKRACDNVKIHHNTIDWTLANAGTEYESAIVLRTLNKCVIGNNTIIGGYGGIDIDASNGAMSDVNINNNIFKDQKKPSASSRGSITFITETASYYKNITLFGNTINNANSNVDGLILNDLDEFTVIGNIINLTGGSAKPISLTRVTNGVINSNTFKSVDTTIYGISYLGDASNLEIGKNMCINAVPEHYYGGAISATVKHTYARSFQITCDGSGNITTVDPHSLLSSVVSQWYGCDVNFNTFVNVLQYTIGISKVGGTPALTFNIRGASGPLLLIGIQDAAQSGFGALATLATSINVTLFE